jgi:hypothetical protein
VAVGAACGGSVSTNGAVDGAVHGAPVTVTDSMAITGLQTYGGATAQFVGAFLTNMSGICGILERKGNPPDIKIIGVSVATTAASIPPGTYRMGYENGFGTQVAYTSDDSTCRTTVNETATTGTVTIKQVTSTTVDGSFDATFSSGDHLSGDFSAPVCPVTLEEAASNMSPCGS